MIHKLTAITSVIALATIFSSSANADHRLARFRQLDDLSFAAFVEARELRWEIYINFVDSHDYQHLLSDADEVIEAMHDLQVDIYRERPDHVIEREIDNVQRRLANLKSHMNGCDFARTLNSRHRPTFNGRGYVYAPETHSGGRGHALTALRMIARIESALEALECAVCGHGRRSTHSNIVPPTIPPAPQPGPLWAPQGTSSRNGRFLEIPVGNASKGGFVFKIGY